MILKIEFDQIDIPFDMQFGDWLPGTSMSPDAVLYKPQNLTPEEKAQALANIGAMAKGRQKSLLINSTDSEVADVTLETNLRHNGTVAFEFYSGSNAVGNEHATVLGGLAAGEVDSDAATVGQVKETAACAALDILLDLGLVPALANADGSILAESGGTILLNL